MSDYQRAFLKGINAAIFCINDAIRQYKERAEKLSPTDFTRAACLSGAGALRVVAQAIEETAEAVAKKSEAANN